LSLGFCIYRHKILKLTVIKPQRLIHSELASKISSQRPYYFPLPWIHEDFFTVIVNPALLFLCSK
jgi:hypothetical protein